MTSLIEDILEQYRLPGARDPYAEVLDLAFGQTNRPGNNAIGSGASLGGNKVENLSPEYNAFPVRSIEGQAAPKSVTVAAQGLAPFLGRSANGNTNSFVDFPLSAQTTANNQGGGGEKRGLVLCADDEHRYNRYVDPSQIRGVVNAAVVQTSFGDYLIGLSGLNVDEKQRYVLCDDGWIDFQHVVSASFNSLANFGLSEIAGIAFEIVQFPEHPGSSFRGEDLRSNHIGQRAAFAFLRSGLQRSLGDCVVDVLSDYVLYNKVAAKHKLVERTACY